MSHDCRICDRRRKADDLLVTGDASGLYALLTEVEDELEHEATENGWRAAILDGSWPQAKELLTLALARLEKP